MGEGAGRRAAALGPRTLDGPLVRAHAPGSDCSYIPESKRKGLLSGPRSFSLMTRLFVCLVLASGFLGTRPRRFTESPFGPNQGAAWEARAPLRVLLEILRLKRGRRRVHSEPTGSEDHHQTPGLEAAEATPGRRDPVRCRSENKSSMFCKYHRWLLVYKHSKTSSSPFPRLFKKLPANVKVNLINERKQMLRKSPKRKIVKIVKLQII